MIHPDTLAKRLVERLRASSLDLGLVSTFTGAVPSTIRDWLDETHPPRGERLNRLWHLLDAAGIDSPELSEVDDFGRYLGKLLAFRVITIEDAQKICGVHNSQAVFQVARGQRKSASPTLDYSQLLQQYGEHLRAKETELLNKLGGTRPQSHRASVATLGAVAVQSDASSAAGAGASESALAGGDDFSGRDRFLVEAAQQLSGVLPLAIHLASDAFTAEERALVRTLLGEEGMFRLSNAINDLCGERVRNTGR